MSHKDAPPESAEQRRMREFYTKRGVRCGWSMARNGRYHAQYANDAWAAWQEAQRTADQPSAAPSMFPTLSEDNATDAARYRWLKAHYYAADFFYGDVGSVLIFDMGSQERRVSANLDATIDEARAADPTKAAP